MCCKHTKLNFTSDTETFLKLNFHLYKERGVLTILKAIFDATVPFDTNSAPLVDHAKFTC